MALGKGQQIAVFIILAQAVGAGGVFLFPVFPFTGDIPVKIAEGNLPVFGNGFLNGIYVVIDAFIHAFDPAGHQHISAQKVCIQGVALVAKLFDQLPGFALR